MKKLWLLTTCLVITFSATACDICGCGGGNSYIGILPDFHQHIFGTRYRYNSLRTHIGAGGTNTYLTTQEVYRNMELWGGWNIANNWRIMVSLPYNFNEKNNSSGNSKKNGLGDVSVSGYYQLLNQKNTVLKDKLLVQSLWIGATVKLPTGMYDPADKGNSTQNVNLFQLGTGSTDFSTALMYDVRLQDAGFNISGMYKVNNSNRYNYRYGNKLTLSTQAYYKLKVKEATVAPNAGLQFESGQKDNDQGYKVELSGGKVLLATVGTEINLNKLAIGFNYQLPLSQQLANGFVHANNRMMLHVGIAL